MKLMFTLVSIMLVSFAASAEEVVSKIVEYKDWQAVVVKNHAAKGSEACIARVLSADKKSVLELFAEKSEGGGFVDPIVQIISNDVPSSLGAIAQIEPGRKKLPFTIALSESDETAKKQVFLAQYGSMGTFIDLLKQKDYVEMKFYSADGEVAKTRFSLRGSSKVIGKAIEQCQLNPRILAGLL